jgi:hypothetical protein
MALLNGTIFCEIFFSFNSSWIFLVPYDNVLGYNELMFVC